MAAMTTKHTIITPEGNPAGYGNTLAEAIKSAAEAYDTTTEAIEAALNSEGPDSLVHVEQAQHFAIMAEDREGPAYGVGLDEAEARQHARESGFGESGSVVKITAQSYNRIMAGDPQAVEIVG